MHAWQAANTKIQASVVKLLNYFRSITRYLSFLTMIFMIFFLDLLSSRLLKQINTMLGLLAFLKFQHQWWRLSTTLLLLLDTGMLPLLILCLIKGCFLFIA